MPARVSWYEPGSIILYTVSDPLTLDDLEQAEEGAWALAGGTNDLLDLIFDYRHLKEFPRGSLPVVKNGHFAMPTLDRVALVGSEPLIEMMMTELTRATFRPDPTLHDTVELAAAYLKRMAQEDLNR
jgi:hypothetical protein